MGLTSAVMKVNDQQGELLRQLALAIPCDERKCPSELFMMIMGKAILWKKGRHSERFRVPCILFFQYADNYLPLFSVIGAGDHCEPVITVIIENLDLIRLNSFVFRHDV